MTRRGGGRGSGRAICSLQPLRRQCTHTAPGSRAAGEPGPPPYHPSRRSLHGACVRVRACLRSACQTRPVTRQRPLRLCCRRCQGAPVCDRAPASPAAAPPAHSPLPTRPQPWPPHGRGLIPAPKPSLSLRLSRSRSLSRRSGLANPDPKPKPKPNPNQGFLERTMTKKNRKDFLSTVGP